LQADRRLLDGAWLRIGIGVAVAAQAMVFSLAVNITPAQGAAYWLVHGGLAASAFAVLGFLGRDLVGQAWMALRERRVSIDLLFLVTLAGALAGSLVSTFTGTGSIYYEVVAVLVVVHTLGKMLGARSRVAALRAVAETAERYDRAQVLGADGRIETRPVATLRGGERVVVPPGGAICVDGEILEGRSYVEEAAMTGEWRPVARGPGEPVWAGTQAVDGRLVIAVRAGGGGRRLDAVLAAVTAARLAPSRLQAQADRLMRWFLPVVAAVSVVTFAGWCWAGPWERALFNAMAVLLVACPCAMGLATPVAVWGGLARLARLGIVARSGDFLEGLARVDTVCFDKTGTLSESAVAVEKWNFEEGWREPGRQAWLKAKVSAAEAGLQHPVARALAAEGGAGGETGLTVRVVPGCGVEATWRDDRTMAGAATEESIIRLQIGEPRWALGEKESCQSMIDKKSGVTASKLGAGLIGGETGKRVLVVVDGAVAATILLGERWRIGLKDTLAGLRSERIAVEVLTGDPHPPAGLDAPVRGGMTPEDKAERVRELGREGRTVLFAGDGLNDASAMGAAAAALAVRGGSDLARAAAMATCAGDDLRMLPEAVRVARRVVRGVRGNLLFASAYNLAGMALAASGKLHPVAAALLMVGSSVAVAVRALRSAEAGGAAQRGSVVLPVTGKPESRR
jgi:heavy metal translocating P-type ATPase